MRQIVLDTETTGLEVTADHRVIEIGALELLDRRPSGRVFQHFLNPDREIDSAAAAVHGITLEQLAEKPRFADILPEFIDFIAGAELIIHNAEFDVGFLDAELARAGHQPPSVAALAGVITDTLPLARHLHPGQHNSLDALCQRYDIDLKRRHRHGALLDAELLAAVYLAMTSEQKSLQLGVAAPAAAPVPMPDTRDIPVLPASADEIAAHEALLAAIEKESGGHCVWLHGGNESLTGC